MASIGSKINYLYLFLILFFASFIYLYKLASIPSGTYSDEATIGYNAYSIATTGKDEYGQTAPIAFRFFGAYTPPLYVYLVAPLIKIFGLNTFYLRLPSIVFTLVGIILIYLFTHNLYTSLLFAICPWVVFNARLGYEVTAGYTIFYLGVYLFYQKFVHSKISYLGLFLLSLSTYVAHPERYLVPIFLVVTSIVFYRQIFIKTNFIKIIIGSTILLVSQIPNLILLFTPAFWVKNTTFILSDFISQYFTYISPKFIFGPSPDINLQHTLPEIPLLYSWLIIPFFIGLYQLYKIKKTDWGKFIIILFLLSPVPGAFSGHFISIQRAIPLIFPIFFIISLGLKPIPKIFFPFLFIFSLVMLWRSYFVFFPINRAYWWSYGYDQVASISQQNPNTFYVFDNTRNPATYMSFLYALQYPPAQFQSNFSTNFVKNYYRNPPYNGNYTLNNISIHPINWEKDIYQDLVIVGDSLTISDSQAKEHFLTKIWEIKYPDNKIAFVAYKTNPLKKIADDKVKALRSRLP
ncbi:hypothetical protein KBC75_03260 [Candidatus Shapirobacteria bacterium]|nr:hypothetical protein [Candidatus Shapirobacteria bacterium]